MLNLFSLDLRWRNHPPKPPSWRRDSAQFSPKKSLKILKPSLLFQSLYDLYVGERFKNHITNSQFTPLEILHKNFLLHQNAALIVSLDLSRNVHFNIILYMWTSLITYFAREKSWTLPQCFHISYSVQNEKSDPEIIIDKNQAHIFSIHGTLKGFEGSSQND